MYYEILVGMMYAVRDLIVPFGNKPEQVTETSEDYVNVLCVADDHNCHPVMLVDEDFDADGWWEFYKSKWQRYETAYLRRLPDNRTYTVRSAEIQMACEPDLRHTYPVEVLDISNKVRPGVQLLPVCVPDNRFSVDDKYLKEVQ